GVLRHGDAAARAAVLGPLLADHGGGWVVPAHARLAVDARYVLFAAGLLAPYAPAAAARLATTQLVDVPPDAAAG
ncbi:MAG TPA: glutamate mutase L, partial [Kineosporiaceae bacterium]|nr:glutamate mutase L [Kineosporiaceae bacterium]